MNDAVDPIVPKIDDRYWFNYSETLVKGGLESRDKAAAAIQTFAIWLWGIYTASAAVGFALAGKEFAFLPTFFIALGSASLIAVYWGTILVQMPVLVEFDPRSPDDIMRVYVSNVAKKDRRLKMTLGLSVLAGVMVSVALVVASVARPNKAVVPSFSAVLTTQESARILSITGYVGKTKSVTMRVGPASMGAAESDIQTDVYVPTESGLIQTNTRLKTTAKEVSVTLEWEDANGMRTRLNRKISDEQTLEQGKPEKSKSAEKTSEDKK